METDPKGGQNTALYGIGVLAVVVLLAGAWVTLGGSGSPAAVGGTQPTTLRTLIAEGTPQRCTFSSSTSDTNASGVVYVASGQLRGDFTSVSANQTLASHLIVKNNTSYVWTDTMQEGILMPFDQMTAGSTGEANINPNEKTEYTCSSWSIEGNVFELPSGLPFQDISNMIGTEIQTLPVSY